MHPYLRLLRPKQWTKNAFVFAPLFFSLQYTSGEVWLLTILAALCFITVSGAVYILNDIHDIAADRAHPIKQSRPLAAGIVPIHTARKIAGALLGAAIVLLCLLPMSCTYIVLIYVGVQLVYTYYLKNFAIVDVVTIATGFVLRVLMGGYAIDVEISPWIISATYLLALFLGFGKRYHEFNTAGENASRASLSGYNAKFLESLLIVSCVAALLTYTLYTVEMARLLDKLEITYTIVFVIIGLFRYLQLLYVYDKGEEPETILLTDRLFQLNAVLWGIATIFILSQ